MIALALWRFLRRTPWSTLMALLGVALGVTSIVSVHLISATVAQQLDQLIPSQLGGFSHFLHRDNMRAEHYFTLRRQWLSEGADDRFLGITTMSPVVDETAVIHGQLLRLIGVDLFAQTSLNPPQPSSASQDSFSWQGVWVDNAVADSGDLVVNGVLEGNSGLLVADIGVAQELLGWDAQRISYIGIKRQDPWQRLKQYGEHLLPGFAAGLPLRAPVLPGLEEFDLLSVAQQHPASQFGKSVLFNISALGLLAMLVAWFLMYQVAISWLRRLWPVFERLHVLGVEWRSLRAYFVAAMGVLGLLGCGLGLVLGRWLAQTLFGLAVEQASPEFTLTSWVVLKALASALGVCLLGGVWAFHRAKVTQTKPLHLGWTVALVVMAMAGIWWPASGLLGGFAAIAVFSVLAALLTTPLLRYLRGKAAHFRGPYLVRWSVREAVWYPQELAVALAGLALAVATAIGVGLMVDSFREDFSRMLERRLSYDIVVRGSDADLAVVAQVLNGHAAGRPDVQRAQSYAHLDTRLNGVPLVMIASRYDRHETARYGLSRPLLADEILLSEQGARLLDTQLGETLVVAGQRLRVAGVFASFGDIQPRLLVPLDSPVAAQVTRLDSISINTHQPGELADELLRTYPGLSVELQSEIRRTALATFDQTFVITTVLIVIAMLVAAIGVYVAVTTLRLNRRSSARLMKGLGLGRLEDVGMDFALGLAMGTVALLIAVPLGIVFGWILCAVINPRAFGWTVELQLTWSALTTPLFWGLVAATVAGLVRVGRGETGGMRGLA